MSKRLHLICLSASLIASLGAALPASADDVCISPRVAESLFACAGGPAPERVPGAKSPVKLPPPAPAKTLKNPTKPPNPDGPGTAVEIRRNIAGVRAIQLLVTQIQGLESLLGSTPASAPDRAPLLRRLADSYVELESSAFRKKIESRGRADEIRRENPTGAAAARAEGDKSEKIEVSARQAAVKYYERLRADYPRWCQTTGPRSSGCLDEVLYNLAYEYEQDQKLDQARKVYLGLVSTFPQSRYIPNAYLAFGELFFTEAQGDPTRWALAEQSYKEVTRYPAPDNTVLGYSHYKLAYVYWNKGDFLQSLSEFKKTIDFGAQFPQLASSKGLAASARRDLLPVYALAGDPKKAHDFLKPLSGDVGVDSTNTYKLMGELGQAYLDTGHFKEGIDLYRDLAGRDRGPKLCSYQSRITEATMAMRSGDKASIKAEMERQVEAMGRFVTQPFPEADKLACKSETAELLIETAMAWHLEATGSDGVRGTNDEKTMDLAADLYERAVRTFSKADFEALRFPRIVKEDWPSRAKIAYLMADLLYARKRWDKCGQAFDAVAADDPRGPLAAESAYTSAICYQNLYHATHEGHSDRVGRAAVPARGAAPDLSPRELSETEKGMLASFSRYLCLPAPAATDKEGRERRVEVAYGRARTYFEARHWEEAAVAFRQIALEHPENDAGIYAAQLYLEALNVLAGTTGRTSCFDDMTVDVPRLATTYCEGGHEKENAEQCGTLLKVERDLLWKKAEALVARATPASFEAGANLYMTIWNKYGKEPCSAKKPGCERMDEVLTNAARAFQAARFVAKAIGVRKMLIDPHFNLDRTELARKAVHDIGGNYQAIAVYEEAASWYERFARESPRLDKAAEAQQDAVLLRLGLGQDEQAMKDAELFEHTYGSQKPALSAQIAFAVGAHDIEREDFASGAKRLSAAMRSIDRSAPVDVQIQAHALLGRALGKTGGATGAAVEFEKVRAAFKDPQGVVKRIVAADDNERNRRIEKILMAVGEAKFFFAEQKRREADRIRFPEYKGSGNRDDVMAHINGKVADWIKRKRPLIEEAEKAYLEILNLPIAPPPRWTIAAGARVGQMWGKFVAEFRAAPVPKEWKQTGPSPFGDLRWEEILGAYTDGIDHASEGFKQRAKQAFVACVDYSVKFQFSDEQSHGCEVWLARNYGSEFHVVDELHGAPTRIGAPVFESPMRISMETEGTRDPSTRRP
jgi:tetratricopeptide (TPR) repeat protein